MSIDRESIVAEFYEAFGQHDIEGMEANLAPEVDWTTADGRRERGRAAFKTYWQGAWQSAEELGEAAGRSKRVADEQMPDDIRWIRSYVLEEGGGSVGTVCIYQASSPEAIRRHGSIADLPVDEIIAVADTVIVRPDPQPVAA